MQIEIIDRGHIRIKDGSGYSFDIYGEVEDGIQIISPGMKPLEVIKRQEPWSIIVREKQQ